MILQPRSWVERIAQAIAHEIDAQDGEEDQRTGE
jgi:hypothetical protein